jgi:arabinofuranosyltransferase
MLTRIRGDRIAFLGLMGISAIGLYFGWRTFWFLTDDAYIAFRYISNSISGYGYVWNAPPFQPVEGYTSFLWVVVLDGIWRLTGLEPPAAANYLTLFFSYLTLLVASTMLLSLKWSDSLRRYRLVFLALFPVFLLSNRTFLAWTSSGLETAMFAFLVILWVLALIRTRSPAKRVFLGALAAAAIHLTRPDGLLFCAATVIISMLLLFRPEAEGRTRKRMLLALSPLTVVCLHFGWRYWYYGAWLPNAYYAKVTAPWPGSGVRYAASFILEYGLWFAIVVALWASASLLSSLRKDYGCSAKQSIVAFLLERLRRSGHDVNIVIALTLTVHFAYYTVIVGGDHFEYRVYNHLVPFAFLAVIWVLNRWARRCITAGILTAVFVVLSLPVQWTHWGLTHDINTREETHIMRIPISPTWPRVFRWYSRLFDEAQDWLITHHVCMRHQEHKVFWLRQIAHYPTREEGAKIPSNGYPVFVAYTVGVPSWVLPNVNVIDFYGLNDYVIARTPLRETKVRRMAHERVAPEGYIRSFRPNVEVRAGKVEVHQRLEPLTESDIIRAESYWRGRLATTETSKRGFRQGPSGF